MNDKPLPILVPLEQAEFWNTLREVIRSEINREELLTRNDMHTVPGLTQKPIYKADEVCAMLQISRQTLHCWVKEGILKAYKIKSRVFFLWTDIEKIIENGAKI